MKESFLIFFNFLMTSRQNYLDLGLLLVFMQLWSRSEPLGILLLTENAGLPVKKTPTFLPEIRLTSVLKLSSDVLKKYPISKKALILIQTSE